MKIKIGGKDWTIRYGLEASLCEAAISDLTELVGIFGESENANNIYLALKGLGLVPKTALSLFYAGLLEEHGRDGDGTIEKIEDAKELIKTYLAESEEGSFLDILVTCLNQITEDKFLDLIGIGKMTGQTDEPVKLLKIPQDHKKKSVQ